MLSRYSSTITMILFALVLGGMFFAAQPAQGYSTPPSGAQTFAASNIQYSLNSTEPNRIAGVSFTLPSDRIVQPAIVRVRLDSIHSAWYACAAVGDTWRCQTPDGPEVAAVDQVQVAVTQ